MLHRSRASAHRRFAAADAVRVDKSPTRCTQRLWRLRTVRESGVVVVVVVRTAPPSGGTYAAAAT